ncbi:hypothetical protein B0T42_14630 [Rathayibacter sp. VKM Ac-2630]|nr:hypothetical protein B0T42_14630 [Rathayibacter sp. VKM Ac-2630]
MVIRRAAPLALTLLLLSGCASTASETTPAEAGSEASEPAAAPLDLTGTWTQSNKNSPDSFQTATITDSAITVEWVSDGGDTTALYWAGTYEAPTDAGTSYTWDSQNDTTQTATAMLASSDATKTFSYDDDVISYKVSALGVTTTVELARD